MNAVERDPLTGRILYATSDDTTATGLPSRPPRTLGDCYQIYFLATEITFQQTDETMLAQMPAEQLEIFDQTFRPCLEQLGVPIPDDLAFQDENWPVLFVEASQALADGRCVVSGG